MVICVAINACKDHLKSFFCSHTVSMEEVLPQEAAASDDHRDVLEAVLSLPEKFRDVVYLYIYEGYSAVEIGGLLGKNVNTVYTLLSRAKRQLRDVLGGLEDE